MEKMKPILGLISMTITLIGVAFKFTGIQGAGMLTVIGGSSLALYVCFLSGIMYNPLTQKKPNLFDLNKASSTILGISTSAFIVGLLFYSMFWPGANIQMRVGSFGIALGLGLTYYNAYKKQKKVKLTPQIFYVIIGVLALALSAAHSSDKIKKHQENEIKNLLIESEE